MPILPKTFGATDTAFRTLSVGSGEDLPTMRQDLAAPVSVASNVDWIWGRHWHYFRGRGADLVPSARRRYSGADVMAAGVCVYPVAGTVCIIRQLSIEMRIV